MKKILFAAIALTVMGSAAAVQAAPRHHHVPTTQQTTEATHGIDGQKLFDGIADRATQ